MSRCCTACCRTCCTTNRSSGVWADTKVCTHCIGVFYLWSICRIPAMMVQPVKLSMLLASMVSGASQTVHTHIITICHWQPMSYSPPPRTLCDYPVFMTVRAVANGLYCVRLGCFFLCTQDNSRPTVVCHLVVVVGLMHR